MTRYERLRRDGMCVACGCVTADAGARCTPCRDSYRQHAKKWRDKAKEKQECRACGGATDGFVHCEPCRKLDNAARKARQARSVQS